MFCGLLNKPLDILILIARVFIFPFFLLCWCVYFVFYFISQFDLSSSWCGYFSSYDIQIKKGNQTNHHRPNIVWIYSIYVIKQCSVSSKDISLIYIADKVNVWNNRNPWNWLNFVCARYYLGFECLRSANVTTKSLRTVYTQIQIPVKKKHLLLDTYHIFYYVNTITCIYVALLYGQTKSVLFVLITTTKSIRVCWFKEIIWYTRYNIKPSTNLSF